MRERENTSRGTGKAFLKPSNTGERAVPFQRYQGFKVIHDHIGYFHAVESLDIILGYWRRRELGQSMRQMYESAQRFVCGE